MRVVTKYLTIIPILLFSFSYSTFAALAGGVDSTPTKYEVNILSIDFVNSSGGNVNFFTGNETIDIASAAAGGSLASLGQGAELPPGNYTQLRITIGPQFTMTGSVADAGFGQPCRTITGGLSSPLAAAQLNSVADGNIAGGPGTAQVIPIPVDNGGNTMTNALAANNLTISGNNYVFTSPINVLIPANAAVLPNTTVSFNVTNAIEFLTTVEGACKIIPAAPSVNVTVS